MCPAVADPPDTEAEDSVVFWILVNFFGRCQRDYFRRSQVSFHLRFCHSVLLEQESAFVDFAAPRLVGQMPESPRFEHQYQSFSAKL